MNNVSKMVAGIVVGAALMTGCSVPSDTGSKIDQAIEDAGKPAKASKTDKPEATSPREKALAKMSVSRQNAVDSALSYLKHGGFSRAGLLDQLTSEYGEAYPPKDAQAAIAFLEKHKAVNWKAEAVQSAESYLKHQSFSRQGLIDQLTSSYGEKFTVEQATYAVNKVGL